MSGHCFRAGSGAVDLRAIVAWSWTFNEHQNGFDVHGFLDATHAIGMWVEGDYSAGRSAQDRLDELLAAWSEARA